MSVSSTNRDRQVAPGNGIGSDDVNVDKEHPDRPNGKAEGSPSLPGVRPDRHVNRIADRTDEELLAAYRDGDRSSFAALVERYQRELFHFLVRFVGDRAGAEDIFQETFLQVHQSADQFDLQRRFRPWLFTIAANKARDLMRSQARRPTNPLQANINGGDDESCQFIDLMESADPMPGEAMEREELQKVVQNTVEGMPEHLREILLLSYFHQFPYKEISDILGIPLGTVKSRLHAAVAYFADRWKNRIQRTVGG
jgi:RNA polymerase sigma-70 factor (ECF subfamily)